MSKDPSAATDALLTLLDEAELPFVVVGGVAGLIHGSGMATQDPDVVMPMEPAILDRLLAALGPRKPRDERGCGSGPRSETRRPTEP